MEMERLMTVVVSGRGLHIHGLGLKRKNGWDLVTKTSYEALGMEGVREWLMVRSCLFRKRNAMRMEYLSLEQCSILYKHDNIVVWCLLWFTF